MALVNMSEADIIRKCDITGQLMHFYPYVNKNHKERHNITPIIGLTRDPGSEQVYTSPINTDSRSTR